MPSLYARIFKYKKYHAYINKHDNMIKAYAQTIFLSKKLLP